MTTVHVPDIPGPRATLCWKQDPTTFRRCDRRAHKDDVRHTWELVASDLRPDARPFRDGYAAGYATAQGGHDYNPDLAWLESVVARAVDPAPAPARPCGYAWAALRAFLDARVQAETFDEADWGAREAYRRVRDQMTTLEAVR